MPVQLGRHTGGILVAVLAILGLQLGGCPTGGGGGGGGAFNLPPTPVITADIVRGVVPLAVQFSSQQSTDDGLIVDRVWDFGDGASSQDISPRHTYNETGVFTVTLTLTDDAGASASRSITISVTQAPIAAFTPDKTFAENAPATFTFDASASNDPDGQLTTFRWSFGDGTTITGDRAAAGVVDHTYALSGDYTVALTVTDNTGVTDSFERIVQVGIAEPQIEFRVPPSTSPYVVISPDAPLWAQVLFQVESGVAFTITAGVDGDRDLCDAQAVVASASDGEPIERLTGQDLPVTDVVYAPDGTFVASSSEDGTVVLFSLESALPIAEFASPGDSPVTALDISANGARIAYGTAAGDVVVRELATGNQAVFSAPAGHSDAVRAVAFSPDASQVASAGADNRAIVWNTQTGTVLRDLAHPAGVNGVSFSPTDPTLLATACDDGTGRLFNLTGGGLVSELLGHNGAVNAVQFSNDGFAIATGGSDNNVIIFSTLLARSLLVLSGHETPVRSLAFSPDGTRLASGSDDGRILTWDPVSGNLLRTDQPCVSPVRGISFSPDGTRYAAAIAAKNATQLDVNPPEGNDINLTVPRALQFGDVATGQAYYLWAQLDTDRTDPVRVYAQQEYFLIDGYTSDIDGDTPAIPLMDDAAAVVVAPDAARQVFDLGRVEAGDRMYLTILTQPGFAERTSLENYNLILLDENEELIAEFKRQIDNTGTAADESLPETIFPATPTEGQFVLNRTTDHLYVVTDTGTSINVRFQRGGQPFEREQRVLLNFPLAPLPSIAVGGLLPQNLNAFNDLDVALRNQVVSTVQSLFDAAGANVVVGSTDSNNIAPPFIEVYFGGIRPANVATTEYGFANAVDPFNTTLSGSAIVWSDQVQNDFPAQGDSARIRTYANIAARAIALEMGLTLTNGGANSIMGRNYDPTSGSLAFTSDAPLYNPFNSSIGILNAPQLLQDNTAAP